MLQGLQRQRPVPESNLVERIQDEDTLCGCQFWGEHEPNFRRNHMTLRSPYRDFRSALRAAFLALISPAVLAAQVSQQRPNFLFILADDLGQHQLGCYGSKYYETPNIDRLAAQGMKFTRAYSAAPICSPTRASLMTGKYPARVRVTDFIPGSNNWINTKLLVARLEQGPSDF